MESQPAVLLFFKSRYNVLYLENAYFSLSYLVSFNPWRELAGKLFQPDSASPIVIMTGSNLLFALVRAAPTPTTPRSDYHVEVNAREVLKPENLWMSVNRARRTNNGKEAEHLSLLWRAGSSKPPKLRGNELNHAYLPGTNL